MNLDDGSEENINYWKEFVASETSLLGFVGSIGLGAVLSIPLGIGFAVIPPLLFCSGGAIASMFVPTSPVYKAHIRQKKRRERINRLEKEMIASLQQKIPEQEAKWISFWKLKEQLDTMKRWSKQGKSLSQSDIDSFEDSILGYLRMWCALIAMRESIRNIDIFDIERRIQKIQKQISETEDGLNLKQLKQAISEYQKILHRHHDLQTRIISMEAKMESLKHSFEEIYQRLISGQISSSMEIQDALGRMRMEEEIDMAVDMELQNFMSKPVSASTKKKLAKRKNQKQKR